MDGETTHEIVPPGETTEEYPTLAGTPDDPLFAEADDEWPVRGPARGVRLGIPVAALIAVLLVAAGFWGGSVVQKDHGSGTSSGFGGGGTAAILARLRGGATGTSGATGATGASGAGGFASLFGGGAAGTTGTLSVVDGNTLYVLTATGSLVKVTLGPQTTITRDATSKANGLRPGDTVVVEGATGKNGDVSATSISATAPGVTSARGFGGFGGRGTGGSGTSTTGSNGTTTTGE